MRVHRFNVVGQCFEKKGNTNYTKKVQIALGYKCPKEKHSDRDSLKFYVLNGVKAQLPADHWQTVCRLIVFVTGVKLTFTNNTTKPL